MRGEWRCVAMGYGGLCVVLAVVGTPEMLRWCAGNLDTRTQVRLMPAATLHTYDVNGN